MTRIVFNPESFNEKAQRIFRKEEKGISPLAPDSSISANDSSASPPAGDSVLVSWFPKDPLVTQPETTILPSRIVQSSNNPSGLTSPRHLVIDPGNAAAQPGQIYSPNDPRFDQGMALAVGEKILSLYEQALARSIPWSFGDPQLWIYVHREEEPNSGYTRGNPKSSNPDEKHGRVELDYFYDLLTGETIQSSESSDIIAHENTHALTDGVRDLYLESFSPDSQAYHEGNADAGAIMLALHNPAVIEQVIAQTGGNLEQDNILADIGEQFGKGMQDDGYIPADTPPFIRSVWNNPQTFSVTDWRKLPFMDENGGIGSEPHSYSRIWSGAWYDSLVGIYNFLREKHGLEPEEALYQAGHVMSDVTPRALEFAPVGDMRFGEMALAFLKAVKTDFGVSGIGAEYRSVIEQSFLNRRILSQNDLDTWNKQEGSIPKIVLDANIQDAASANSWLAKNAATLSAFDSKFKNALKQLQFKEVYSNRLGETFLNFTFKQSVTLNANDFADPSLLQRQKDFKGTTFDVWGGLTLGFDPYGKLFAYTFDDIPPTEISDDKDYILLLISQGLIQGGSGAASPVLPRAPHQQRIKIRGCIVKEKGKRTIRRAQTLM